MPGWSRSTSFSDRLTRIELDLDVLPTNPAEGASMALGIGRRRAEAELRRFKAHVEFINPDVYESEEDRTETRTRVRVRRNRGA